MCPGHISPGDWAMGMRRFETSSFEKGHLQGRRDPLCRPVGLARWVGDSPHSRVWSFGGKRKKTQLGGGCGWGGLGQPPASGGHILSLVPLCLQRFPQFKMNKTSVEGQKG